jgi:hypothetical protein
LSAGFTIKSLNNVCLSIPKFVSILVYKSSSALVILLATLSPADSHPYATVKSSVRLELDLPSKIALPNKEVNGEIIIEFTPVSFIEGSTI